jgi:hypothetical protein
VSPVRRDFNSQSDAGAAKFSGVVKTTSAEATLNGGEDVEIRDGEIKIL